MEQEPKVENLLPVQERIIDRMAKQTADLVQDIMRQVARGEIGSEEAKRRILEQVKIMFDTPLEHVDK